MRDEAARAAAQRLGELRRRNRGGRAREHGLGGRDAVERREDFALDVERLRQVLLHPIDIRKRLVERGCSVDARARRIGVGDEPVFRLLVEARRDETLRSVRSCAASRSWTRTCQPARANTIAQARPIRPAPIDCYGLVHRPHIHSTRRRRSRFSRSCLCRSLMDNAAALQHIGAVRQAPSTRSRLCSTITIATSPRSRSNASNSSSTTAGARPFERLVQQQHAYVARQRARDRDHLLLAAGQVIGRRVEPRGRGAERTRGSSRRSTRHPCLPRRLSRPSSRLSRTLIPAKSPCPAARSRCRAARSARRGQLLQIVAAERDPPPLARAMPMIVFSSVDLPAPLRPSSATISCSWATSDASRRMWLLP